MSESNLFSSFSFKHFTLKNRMLMAPMTRARADAQGVPTEMMVEYYRQRASAGMIITEGVSPSKNGKGYARMPGIYSDAQLQGWKRVTQAVHDAGGKITLQIMHTGRIGHSLNLEAGAQLVSASEVTAAGSIFTDQSGMQNIGSPKMLSKAGIQEVIAEYQQATRRAFEAGFDGVELHVCSGYLPQQFLSSNTNLRQDEYGGSVDNRIRFTMELLVAMASVQGADKIGIRIWPGSTFNDIHDANPVETHRVLLQALNTLNLAYVHVIRSPDENIDAFALVKQYYQGTKMLNGGFQLESAQAALNAGLGDLIAFGSLFLANPDLPERFHQHAKLNTPDPTTFYSGGEKGYIDYPFLDSLN